MTGRLQDDLTLDAIAPTCTRDLIPQALRQPAPHDAKKRTPTDEEATHLTSTATDKVTETMAAFYCSTTFGDLPPDIVQATKRIIEDTLGCIVGGFSMPSSQIINQVMTTQGGVPEATVLVSGVRLPATLASYINSHMANALDGDDVFMPASHLAAGIVPPALAVAESEQRSGSDLITAVALGYEMAGRINRSLKRFNPVKSKDSDTRLFGMGWGSFGSTVAAGRLLGLSQDQMRNAFGIAAAHTPLPVAGKRSHPKPMGKYAMFGPIGQAGVTAALLAKAGFTAHQNIFDGPDGLWRMTGESADCNWEALAGSLGESWLVNDGLFKLYPAVWGFQGAVDLVYRLRSEKSWNPTDVDRVDVHMFSPPLKTHPQVLELETAVTGCFNLPHLLSCAAFGLPPGPDWHMPEAHRDRRLRTFAAKVHTHPWEESVTRIVISAGNRRLELRQGDGQPDIVVSDDDLDVKFQNFCARALDNSRTREALGMVRNLEDQQSIDALVRTLIHA
jgi:2-methylcitrate dehydratase PrpD